MGVDPATIVLPPELRPSDGRFGSGPSKVRPEAVARLTEVAGDYLGTSHRRPGVRDVVHRVRAGLAALFSLPDGYEVLLGNGGTTAFWDAASFGLVQRRTEHLSFGEFSSKFAAVTLAAPHLEDPIIIESEPGTHPDPVVDASVDAYALTHNETSTGVMADVIRPEGAHGIVLVDATSAAAGLRVDPNQYDVYYFAPQKSLAVRRRLVARVLLAGGHRADRADRRDRALVPAVARPPDRAREQPARPDLQHAGARDVVPPRRHHRVDERPGRARMGRLALRPVRRDPLRLGRGERARDPVRREAVGAEPSERDDRLRGRRRQRDRGRPARRTGSSTPSPTASSVATSCASRCSPRSIPPTSRRRRARSIPSSSRSRERRPVAPWPCPTDWSRSSSVTARRASSSSPSSPSSRPIRRHRSRS